MRQQRFSALPGIMGRCPPATIEDGHERCIQASFSPGTGSASYLRFARDHSQRIWKVLRRQVPQRPGIVCGAQACRLLEEGMGATETWARQLATLYSPLNWLWMLRRLPASVFAGDHPTTLAQNRTLAEVLTGSAPPRPGTVLHNEGQVSYQLNARVLNNLRQLCNATIYLADLHVAYRFASKGASVEFRPDWPPEADATAELRKAVQLYDARLAAEKRPIDRLGVGSVDVVGGALAKGGELFGVTSIAPAMLTVSADLLGVVASKTSAEDVAFLSHYIPHSLTGESLYRLRALETRSEVAILILLHSAWLHVARHVSAWHSVLTRGYLILGRGKLSDQLQEAIEELPDYLSECAQKLGLTSTASVLEAIYAIRGETRPLSSGPLIRFDGDVACIDLASATAAFGVIEAPNVNGELARVRGRAFEDAVQEVIDATAWRPSLQMASLRRRDLGNGKRTITDIDAIAEHDGQLLLVSCKSVVYRGAHDAGEYRAIRNAEDRVVEAVDEWRSKVDYFRRHPIGSNYDFSRFTRIDGIVCTSSVFYVKEGLATQEALPGLLAASSLSELEYWLRLPTV